MRLQDAWENPYFREGLGTVGLILVVLLLRSLAARAIRRSQLDADVRRRWLAQLRNAAVLVVLVGFVAIWDEQIRSLALSLAAIAVAMVIATKELLLCLAGSFYRTASRAFTVGDRIEVAGVRGDVVDVGAFTTTLLEIGRDPALRTGRAVVLPNALLLSQGVHSESFTGAYVLETLVVPLARGRDDWRRAEAALLRAARETCAPHVEAAREHLMAVAARHELEAAHVDARVSVRLPDPERVELHLRFPAPRRTSGRLEQEILRRYLDAYAGSATAATDQPAATAATDPPATGA